MNCATSVKELLSSFSAIDQSRSSHRIKPRLWVHEIPAFFTVCFSNVIGNIREIKSMTSWWPSIPGSYKPVLTTPQSFTEVSAENFSTLNFPNPRHLFPPPPFVAPQLFANPAHQIFVHNLAQMCSKFFQTDIIFFKTSRKKVFFWE